MMVKMVLVKMVLVKIVMVEVGQGGQLQEDQQGQVVDDDDGGDGDGEDSEVDGDTGIIYNLYADYDDDELLE